MYMRRRSAILIAAAALLAAAIPASAFDGPLRVRNQFPPFVAMSQPVLQSAVPADSLSIGLSHSSVYVIESNPSWTFNLDMELTELCMTYRKHVRGLFEAGIELPVYRPIAGFMDGFLDWYHSAFGFPDYGRSERPENDFLYDITRDGAVVVKGVDGRAGFGDVRFSLKRPLRAAGPAVSIAASFELPTGDADTGYGSGGYDAAFSLLADAKLGDVIMLYANAGAVFPGDLRARERVGLRNFAYGGMGIEAALWKRWSLLAQVWAQGSPYPDTRIRQIDQSAVIFAFGARYGDSRGTVEVSLTEDPNTSGAPDFILNATYTIPF